MAVDLNKPTKQLLVYYLFTDNPEELEDMAANVARRQSSDMYRELADFVDSRGFEVRFQDFKLHAPEYQIIHPRYRADKSICLRIYFDVKKKGEEAYFRAMFQSINGEPFQGFYKQDY